MKKKNKLLNGLFNKNEAKKGSNKQIDDGKTSGSNDSRKRNTIDGVFRDGPPADELHLYDLDEADELFMKSQYNEALEKYQDALPFAEIKFGPSNPTVGDIHVKISTIQQGKSKLQPAVEHLTNAMEIYKRAINESSGDNSEYVLVLQRKLVEIMTCIANIYVDMGEMEKANDMYHVSVIFLSSIHLFISSQRLTNKVCTTGCNRIK
jgi:tetratricopeptide (TPR) repeat protein